MTWALKRQILYFLGLAIFIFGMIYVVFYPEFHKAPTCTDGKKNGDEVGVDCGGSCAIACSIQTSDVALLWTRSFKVVDGRYNAVAYLENQNKNAAVYNIHYRFRFADKDNLYIGSREGETFIPPNSKFAIFEPAVDVGHAVPVFTTFEFTEKPTWIQVPFEKLSQLKLSVLDSSFSSEENIPRLSTSIKNNSLFDIPSIKVVAILYDASGNAIDMSSTMIEKIKPNQTLPVSFTWRTPTEVTVIKKEIIPMFNIFSVKF